LFLVDWVADPTMRNVGSIKRALDSRCALPGCAHVKRDASLFIVAIAVDKEQWKLQRGAVDILARM